MFKKFAALAVMLFLFASAGYSQTVSLAGPGGRVAFPVVTTVGQVGNYISHKNSNASPLTYGLDWSIAGTAPSVCTFQAEGSSDGTHWNKLNASPISCTTQGLTFITLSPVVFFRVNVLTYTAGDVTTAVTFNYTKGQ